MILTLQVSREHYNLIDSGNQTCVYRDLRRFHDYCDEFDKGKALLGIGNPKYKSFVRIEVWPKGVKRLVGHPEVMRFTFGGIEIEDGLPIYGGKDEKMFKIKLGERL